MASNISAGRRTGRVLICSWSIVPTDAAGTLPTRFWLRPWETTRPIVLYEWVDFGSGLGFGLGVGLTATARTTAASILPHFYSLQLVRDTVSRDLQS